MNLSEWRDKSTVFDDMDPEHFAFLESQAHERLIASSETLFRVNEPANRFFLVMHGTIALQITEPSRPTITIQTVGTGALLGLSWHIPPYRWQWTARAVEETTVAEFSANEVLSACEADRELDAALLRVIARESGKRLHNVRLQLLDLYGQQ